jgi:hypothetical protein
MVASANLHGASQKTQTATAGIEPVIETIIGSNWQAPPSFSPRHAIWEIRVGAHGAPQCGRAMLREVLYEKEMAGLASQRGLF